MAFLISQGQHRRRPLSEAEELKLKAGHEEERGTGGDAGHVTTRLYLSKAPSDAASSLEKDAVLRRIRHHRRINRVRTAFESILGGSSSVQEEPLDDDAFSSP
ncbi:hypothetical protein EUGRSUZ_I01021 [Eucalyptus grandis]|uniref:Uncharacterized protein n=2 Tax=Eucalyptus grandis TaxID=71139 RepID=A0ACC3JE93_EUCGR|nr:hypothetical protein EUGRSUZ_I01021 [Eucalyptus grandis]